jgi:acyl-CoA thioesterase-1
MTSSNKRWRRKPVLICFLIVGLGVIFVAAEALYVIYSGTAVQAPNIPRQTSKSGSSATTLTYVVMGDSTSIGQGAPYKVSIGPKSMEQLAQKYQVSYTNLGVSGARTQDVVTTQLPAASALKPDLVLLSIGANDATHLTSGKSLSSNMSKIASQLIAANCNVKIVLTGSPAMGSVLRFPWPLKQFMGLREKQVNQAYAPVIAAKQLTFAELAIKTGPAFAQHPDYFAGDKFHPNAAGYAVWVPVINGALAKALASQPSHC